VEKLSYFNNASMPKYQTDVGYATTNNTLASTERQTADANAAALEQQKLVNAGNLATTNAQLKAAEKSQDKQIDLTKWGIQNGVTIDSEGNVKQPENQKMSDYEIEQAKNKAEAEWNVFKNQFAKETVQNFVTKYIKPYYDADKAPVDTELIEIIVNNSKAYEINIEDAKKILSAYDIDTSKLDGYENSGKGIKKKGETSSAIGPTPHPTASR